jgi:hypothetical protein
MIGVWFSLVWSGLLLGIRLAPVAVPVPVHGIAGVLWFWSGFPIAGLAVT